MWQVIPGFDVPDARSDLAVRTESGPWETRHVRPLRNGALPAFGVVPIRSLPCAQRFEFLAEPVVCMRECEADPRCKAFVTYGESCYFKQDIPEGLDAVKVCAAHPIFPQYR